MPHPPLPDEVTAVRFARPVAVGPKGTPSYETQDSAKDPALSIRLEKGCVVLSRVVEAKRYTKAWPLSGGAVVDLEWAPADVARESAQVPRRSCGCVLTTCEHRTPAAPLDEERRLCAPEDNERTRAGLPPTEKPLGTRPEHPLANDAGLVVDLDGGKSRPATPGEVEMEQRAGERLKDRISQMDAAMPAQGPLLGQNRAPLSGTPPASAGVLQNAAPPTAKPPESPPSESRKPGKKGGGRQ